MDVRRRTPQKQWPADTDLSLTGLGGKPYIRATLTKASAHRLFQMMLRTRRSLGGVAQLVRAEES
jgi:hypothetical protein